MRQKIVIAGSGFAGMWAALSAARAVSLAGRENDVEVLVVSPEPNIVIRPRLYETAFEEMAPDIGPLFEAVGVRHLPGRVEKIHAAKHEIEITNGRGEHENLAYDKFVLATGSTMFKPPVSGLEDYSFNVDQLSGAVKLHEHLKALADKPDSTSRNTVVVVGGGFTGIETAAEMPHRLREILGGSAEIRVYLLEQASDIGPDLGPGPRPVIREALKELNVQVLEGASATAITGDSITTSSGETIPTNTVIWTAGARANGLAAQIPGEHDRLGRVHADGELHATQAPDIFVTGDTAMAATDDEGNTAAMSCQHALSLGRVAGHNAAAELVGLPLSRYSQPKYVTCLDLGPWGAVYTEGWDRQVHMKGEEAKALKRSINTEWIYPPAADKTVAFKAADPAFVVVP